jgi:hypothetical protein
LFFNRFFDQLGSVFKFVKDDVVQKLIILQEFVDSDDNDTPHFDTIQKAIDYETENNLIETNSENFARTLLRLHRALIFIEEFLRGLTERPSSDSTVTIATTAYDSTLYYHRKLTYEKFLHKRFYFNLLRKILQKQNPLSDRFIVVGSSLFTHSFIIVSDCDFLSITNAYWYS